jgi:hypothetical protein
MRLATDERPHRIPALPGSDGPPHVIGIAKGIGAKVAVSLLGLLDRRDRFYEELILQSRIF